MDATFWIQTGITALIAFGATFSGVFLSFWVERRRRHKQEKIQFAQILHTMRVESALNESRLSSICEQWPWENAPSIKISTEALQRALLNTLFHRWAKPVLVASANVVGFMAADLIQQRIVPGTRMTKEEARNLRDDVEYVRKVFAAIQDMLNEKIEECGVKMEAVSGATLIDRRLAAVFRERMKEFGEEAAPKSEIEKGERRKRWFSKLRSKV